MTNCLITKRGKTIECNGGSHDTLCRIEFNCTLRHFLKRNGGVRVLANQRREFIAIEYYNKPSDKQMSIVRKILREANYYTVILTNKTITKFLPIRGFCP